MRNTLMRFAYCLVINFVAVNATAATFTGNLFSVDFQATGPTAPTTFSGVEPNYGFGNVWNAFGLPQWGGSVTNPSLALVESSGAASTVNFSFTGNVTGWSTTGTSLLTRDYQILGFGGFANPAPWTITGLTPGGTYEFYAYGGQITPSRDPNITVDQTATTLTVPDTGSLFASITADGLGQITGSAFSPGGEKNWSGFQLRDISPIPEPSSFALAALGLLGLGLRRRRRQR